MPELRPVGSSSLTRDGTGAPASGAWSLRTGPPRTSLQVWVLAVPSSISVPAQAVSSHSLALKRRSRLPVSCPNLKRGFNVHLFPHPGRQWWEAESPPRAESFARVSPSSSPCVSISFTRKTRLGAPPRPGAPAVPGTRSGSPRPPPALRGPGLTTRPLVLSRPGGHLPSRSPQPAPPPQGPRHGEPSAAEAQTPRRETRASAERPLQSLALRPSGGSGGAPGWGPPGAGPGLWGHAGSGFWFLPVLAM